MLRCFGERVRVECQWFIFAGACGYTQTLCDGSRREPQHLEPAPSDFTRGALKESVNIQVNGGGGSAKDARRPETFKRDGDENEEKWPSAAECKIERVLTIVEEEYYEGSLPCFPGRVSWSAFSL